MSTIRVKGMTCGGCAKAVERAIGRVEGVTEVRVDLDSGNVEVQGPAKPEDVVQAVVRAGFEVGA